MSLSVIPLTILGQITGVTGSGETALYQVSFKSIDGTPLYGVTAVWTDEQAEIEALAAQKPYGVWINPVSGTFTVKFAGYTYKGSADLTDPDVLAGITPIEFANQSGGSSLPAVTTDDDGKMLQVDEGEWEVKQYPVEMGEDVYFDGTVTIGFPPLTNVTLTGDYNQAQFAEWDVTVDGNTMTYVSSEGGEFVDNTESPTITFGRVQDRYVLGAKYDSAQGNHTLKVSMPIEKLDENFVRAVKMVLNIPTTDGEGYSMNISNGTISWSIGQ